MISNEELSHHVWFRDKIIPWMKARDIHVPAAATPDELLEEISKKLIGFDGSYYIPNSSEMEKPMAKRFTVEVEQAGADVVLGSFDTFEEATIFLGELNDSPKYKDETLMIVESEEEK